MRGNSHAFSSFVTVYSNKLSITDFCIRYFYYNMPNIVRNLIFHSYKSIATALQTNSIEVNNH